MDRRKRILANKYEAATHEALIEAASNSGAKVFPKVRVADAIDIDKSGLSDPEYSYALRAHFDFVITREDAKAAFAVEFDGPLHDRNPETIRRDNLKNSICKKLGMPLLRIDAGYLRKLSRFTLIGWMVEVWFLAEAFYDAQESGSVPWDEPFTYSSIIDLAYRDESGKLVELDIMELPSDELKAVLNNKHRLVMLTPYDPFLPYRTYIHGQYQRGTCMYPSPQIAIAKDPQGYDVALALIRLNPPKNRPLDIRVVAGRARIRPFNFPPIYGRELIEELAVVDAANNLRRCLQGRYTALSVSEAVQLQSGMSDWEEFRIHY